MLSNDLPGSFRLLVQRLMDHLNELDKQLDELEAQIKAWHRESAASCKLEKIPGIGPITASALVASIGNAKNFDDGTQLAAWLGLVPQAALNRVASRSCLASASEAIRICARC